MANVEVGAGETTPAPAASKLVLEIDITHATIGDMQAIDRLANGNPGNFADGVDTLAKFVKNIDIRTRPRNEFRAIAEAIMTQFKEESQGN